MPYSKQDPERLLKVQTVVRLMPPSQAKPSLVLALSHTSSGTLSSQNSRPFMQEAGQWALSFQLHGRMSTRKERRHNRAPKMATKPTTSSYLYQKCKYHAQPTARHQQLPLLLDQPIRKILIRMRLSRCNLLVLHRGQHPLLGRTSLPRDSLSCSLKTLDQLKSARQPTQSRIHKVVQKPDVNMQRCDIDVVRMLVFRSAE